MVAVERIFAASVILHLKLQISLSRRQEPFFWIVDALGIYAKFRFDKNFAKKYFFLTYVNAMPLLLL